MSQSAVLQLVKSLTTSEKRHFKLSAKKHAGNKDYLYLFDLIDQHQMYDVKELKRKYAERYPGASMDNAARYLVKLVLESLTHSRVKEDPSIQLLHGLIRFNILNERNLSALGFKELKKLQQIALTSQNYLMQYLLSRHELNYLAKLNFGNVSENDLVQLQMKARDALKTILNTHEHYSLYELLRFRLVNTGKVISGTEQKQLNDLLLSEMSIVNARIKNNLESRKLHLLFQSYFFTDIGDYSSASKTFYELNNLFEKNTMLQHNPPLDYLSALDGILDSLRTIGQFNEMPFYIEKLMQLDKPENPAYFLYSVRKSIIIYQLVFFLGTREYKKAAAYIEKINAREINDFKLVDEEKQNELFFCCSLVYFMNKNIKKANKYINEIVLVGKISAHSIIYRASRLFSILMQYEFGNDTNLEYDIRSYKRTFQNNGQRLKLENLLFKVIKLNPKAGSRHKNGLAWVKLASQLINIDKDKYERQLLKYFDFTSWISDQFNG